MYRRGAQTCGGDSVSFVGSAHPQRKAARLRSAVCVTIEGLERRTLLSTAVLSFHNDINSTGVNGTETQLTASSVKTSTFGKQFSTPMDGQVYAQPLYVPGVNITAGNQQGVRNVAYVATEHDSLYAIDSNGGNVLWKTSFATLAQGLAGATSVTSVPQSDITSTDISVEIGITATPVIDQATNSIYLVAKTKQILNNDAAHPHYVFTLYRVSIQSGAITESTVIGDTIYSGGTYTYRTSQDPYVPGTGDGAITVSGQSRVYFNALREANRPGLVLNNGKLYLAFASHGDNGPYHGWLLRYDASTLTLTGALNTTPNGGLGGIWQGGDITPIDAQGNIYFETGNGTFDGNAVKDSSGNIIGTSGLDANGFPVNGNYGDCFLKISDDPTHNSPTNQNKNGWGLQVADYFSPFNNQALNSVDRDLGSGGPVLLPDSMGSTQHPHLLIGAGKEGKLYLIDRDNMGKFDAATDHVVQNIGSALSGAMGAPAFLAAPGAASGQIYWGECYGGPTRVWTISTGAISPTTYTSQTPDTFGNLCSTPSVSANISGSTILNPIVWQLDRGTNQLRAYDANNLATELWTSAQAGSRDQLDSVVKFSVPTVADGLVFVGTSDALFVYGPPVPPTTAPAAPGNLIAASPNFQTVTLAWQDNSNNESSFIIERSTDNKTFTQVGTAGANSTTYSDSNGVLATTTYYYRVKATNAIGDSGYTNVANVTTPQAPPIGTGDGLAGAYYNDPSPSYPHLQDPPALTRVDPQVNFNWGSGSPASGTIGVDHFSVRWTGKVQPQYSETYTFYTESDDGIRLWVNGQQLVNNWTDHSPTENVGTIALSAGQQYTLELDYYENGGGAEAELLWSSTSTPKEAIPQTQLYSGVAPAAPTNLTATAMAGTEIDLAWHDNSNIETGYSVERKIGSNGTYAVVTTLPANSTTYMDTSLVPNTQYFYRVQALNFAQNSAYSNEVSLVTPVPPQTPSNSQIVSVTTTSISFSWQDNSNNEDGFRIFRRIGAGAYDQIDTLAPNTTTYTDTSLLPGTDYDYHIQAYNVAGYSDFTGVATRTLTLPPTQLRASASDGQVLLYWVAPTGATSYNIYRATSSAGEGSTPVALNVATTSYTDTGLTNGTAYYYEVTAVDAGGESQRSAEISSTPAAGQPISLLGTSGDDSFYLLRDADGQHIDIWLNAATPGSGTPTGRFPLAAPGISIYGNGGNDTVTIDESAGEILPAGASANTITTSAAGTVALNLIGTPGNDTAMLDGSARTASIGGKSISITAGTLASLGYTSTGGNDALTINGTTPVALNVNGGTTTLAANAGTGIRPVNFSSLSIGATGTFRMAGSSSTIGDYSKHANRSVAVIAAGGLSVASGGTLDLEDNDLILRYSPSLSAETAAKSQVNGLLTSAFDGGLWDGAGITSLAAAADASGTRSLGWGDNLDLGLSSFDGVDVSDGTEILVKFTYYGDATLDGKVDAADNSQVAAGLQNTGTGWAFGDFDYSGGKPTAADNSLFAGGLSGYRQFGSL